jgi:hypothetical protein
MYFRRHASIRHSVRLSSSGIFGRSVRVRAAGVAVSIFACLGFGCGSDDPPATPVRLSRAELLKPESCKECHETHYTEWAGSMHAYAADDPVFIAMNERGQRETGGQLGNFCVTCHAPMAVREGRTTDGLNLAELPRELKGVTCYFCHNVESVEGDHNNLVTLANDRTMRGAIRDPIESGAHDSAYSEFTDREALKSSDACGACHDLRLTGPQFSQDVHLERTFEEWRATVFNQPGPSGQRCGNCHMPTDPHFRGPIADVPGLKLQNRPRHLHTFPGVDLALTPFPEDAPQNDAQRNEVQSFLDASLVTEICVPRAMPMIRVVIDNATAGHHFPSGASQDRRVWVELKAFAGGVEIFSTVTVPEGQSVVEAAKAQPERSLWLMRDEVVKSNGEEAHMFWDVARVVPRSESRSPTISGTLVDNPFNSAHLIRTFPEAGKRAPTQLPDRVTLDIYIRPMDFDVIDDLIASGDLAPQFRQTIPTLALLPNRGTASPYANVNFEWTRARAQAEGYVVVPPGERQPFDCLGLPRTR